MLIGEVLSKIYRVLNCSLKTTKVSFETNGIINELPNEYVEKYKNEFGYIQENIKYINQVALYQASKNIYQLHCQHSRNFIPKLKTFVSTMIIKKQLKNN
ncbi:hypothetical protein HDU92_007082 [Lobulomyces angularis]|nr:hypothetical protein HDU92_007082 [Lobulomyces angularis]